MATAALDRPVLVTGTPRSGKSSVADTLGMLPEFLFLDEPLMIWELGHKRSNDDLRPASDATDAVKRQIREALSRRVEGAGKRRYVDNLSLHALRLGFVREVLPDARIIVCQRNVHDIVPEAVYGWTFKFSATDAVSRRLSSLELRSIPRLAWKFARRYLSTRTKGSHTGWGPQTPGLREFAQRNGPNLGAARQWAQISEVFLRDLDVFPEEQRLVVRFEDVLEDPAREFERIGRFCEVEDIEGLQRAALGWLDSDHKGPWSAIPQEDWTRILPIVDSLNQRQGYPPLDPTPPVTALRHQSRGSAAVP
jgi:hypothetical protein